MTRLTDAAEALGLNAEMSPSGRWLRFQDGQRTIYVLKAAWGDDYYMWCEPQAAPVPELYRDPVAAMQAGLRRAGGRAAYR